MSSFGALEIDARRTPFDAVVAASGKCLEGPPGMGFVIVGILSVLAPSTWSDALLALGFGGLHIVFGFVIARRHGG